MVLRDEITQVILDQQSDGMGGFTTTKISQTPIKCKASFNTSPEKANEYGLASEQVLYVITSQELLREAFYYFKGKRYQVRFEVDRRNRLYFSTLVEVKEEYHNDKH